MISRIKSYIKIEHLMYAAWTIALVATVGSWSLSEIMHLPPCSLCWIQRIFMYPLALIMPIGILRRDPDLPYYVLPLSVGGMIVAFYHTLLQWGLISEAAAPCVGGVSCTEVQLAVWGFATIPFGSFLSFVAVTGLVGWAFWRQRRQNSLQS